MSYGYQNLLKKYLIIKRTYKEELCFYFSSEKDNLMSKHWNTVFVYCLINTVIDLLQKNIHALFKTIVQSSPAPSVIRYFFLSFRCYSGKHFYCQLHCHRICALLKTNTGLFMTRKKLGIFLTVIN